MTEEMEIGSLTELAYLNPEKTIIQALNTWAGGSTYITIEQEYDVFNLFDRCVAGEFGTISEDSIVYPDPEIIVKRRAMQISRLQAKAIMYQYGLLDNVEQVIAESDFIIQLAWKEAQVFERLSPLIETLKYEITWPDGSELTDEQIDNMFEEGANIQF